MLDQSPSLEGRRILVVEDEIIVAFNMECEIIDAGGTAVGPAYSLKEALEYVGREPFDAAVLDINLAGKEVWPIADELRSRGVPFLFASANCSHQVLRQGRFAGSVCLDKPVSTRTLIRSIADLFAGGNAAKAASEHRRDSQG